MCVCVCVCVCLCVCVCVCYRTVTYPLMDSSKSHNNREASTLVVGMNGQPVVETGYLTDL